MYGYIICLILCIGTMMLCSADYNQFQQLAHVIEYNRIQCMDKIKSNTNQQYNY